jgi:hypothetical protein
MCPTEYILDLCYNREKWALRLITLGTKITTNASWDNSLITQIFLYLCAPWTSLMWFFNINCTHFIDKETDCEWLSNLPKKLSAGGETGN